jgi:hypothetical protein
MMKSKLLDFYITFPRRLPSLRDKYVHVVAESREEVENAITTRYPVYEKIYCPNKKGKNDFNPGNLEKLMEIICHSDRD